MEHEATEGISIGFNIDKPIVKSASTPLIKLNSPYGGVNYGNFTMNASLLNSKDVFESYHLLFDVSDLHLTDSFREAINELAIAMQSNQGQKVEYLSQTVVRNYGTHLINEAVMGALIEKQELNAVGEQFINETQKQNITTDLPIMMTQSEGNSGINKPSAVTNFNHSRSRIISKKGDISEIPNEDSNEVHYEVANITVLKNSARFLWHAVTQNHFPELDIQILDKIRSSLENAVKTYYKANEISGCLNKGAINYKPQANKEDGSCVLMDTASIFGGIHRTCSFNIRDSSNQNFLTKLSNMVSSSDLDKESKMRCARMSIQNQLTNKLFCSIGFSSNLVHRQRVTLYINGLAVDFILKTFACSRPLADGYVGNHSILFGGFFELPVDDVDYEEMQTLVQAVNGCPSLFQPIHFVGKFFICLAQNVPELRPSAVSLGGFISCQMSSQQTCPLGYTPRLITDWQSCPVSHCIRERDVNPTGRPNFKLPPFMNYPSTDPSDQPPTRSKRSTLFPFRPKHRMNYDRSIGKGDASTAVDFVDHKPAPPTVIQISFGQIKE
ncbi:hypothetical protein WR25_02152 [Diploscapter pachys]|uniref:MACPF domain-containing protein n=1 Tax=Diploscapter pachys TaxID=2018661 RepID=A0A2A2KM62_9BILA|nr:hypothetical protein WR25_02152 [Diploscapter pachys]